MSVNAGQDHDFLLRHEVEDAIGKSTEQRTPHVAVDDGEGKRIVFDGVETLIKCLKELGTKVVTSVAVPRENTFDVRLRCAAGVRRRITSCAPRSRGSVTRAAPP